MASPLPTALSQTLSLSTALTTEQKHQLRTKALHLTTPASPRAPSLLRKSSAITSSPHNITCSDLDSSILDLCYDSGGSGSIDCNVRSIRFTTAASNIDRLIGSPLSTKKHRPAVVLTPVSVMFDNARNLSEDPLLSPSSARSAEDRTDLGDNDDARNDADLDDDDNKNNNNSEADDVGDDDDDVRTFYSKNIRLRDQLKHDSSTENVKRRLPFTATEPVSPAPQSSLEKANMPRLSDPVRVEISDMTWSELSPCADGSADVALRSREYSKSIGGQDSAEHISASSEAANGNEKEKKVVVEEPAVTYGSMNARWRPLRDSYSLNRMRPKTDDQSATKESSWDHGEMAREFYQPDMARYKGVTHNVPYGESQQWERALVDELMGRVAWDEDGRASRSGLQSLRKSFSKLGKRVTNMSIWQQWKAFVGNVRSRRC